MGEYVRKTLAGYRPAGRPEATHLILTVKEYEEYQQMLCDLHMVIQKTKENGRTEIQVIKTDAMAQLATLRREYEEQIRVLQAKSEKLEKAVQSDEEKLEHQINMNANLLRIMRERTNARRKIVPKKAHDGYIITACRQCRDYLEIRTGADQNIKQPAASKKPHRFNIPERIPVNVWKLTIQTPYSVSLPVTEIQEQILEEMMTGLLAEAGCERISDAPGSYPAATENRNMLYKWEFLADLRDGLWSINTYLTEQPYIPPGRYRIREAKENNDITQVVSQKET